MTSFKLNGKVCALLVLVGMGRVLAGPSVSTTDDPFGRLEGVRDTLQVTESRITSIGKSVEKEARNVQALAREFRRTGDTKAVTSELNKAVDRMAILAEGIDNAETVLADVEAELVELLKSVGRTGDASIVAAAKALLAKVNAQQDLLAEVSDNHAKVSTAISNVREEVASGTIATRE